MLKRQWQTTKHGLTYEPNAHNEIKPIPTQYTHLKLNTMERTDVHIHTHTPGSAYEYT